MAPKTTSGSGFHSALRGPSAIAEHLGVFCCGHIPNSLHSIETDGEARTACPAHNDHTDTKAQQSNMHRSVTGKNTENTAMTNTHAHS